MVLIGVHCSGLMSLQENCHFNAWKPINYGNLDIPKCMQTLAMTVLETIGYSYLNCHAEFSGSAVHTRLLSGA